MSTSKRLHASRWLLTAALGLATTGCGAVVMGSPNVRPMLRTFPYRGHPAIARQLRVTYLTNSVLNGHAGKPMIALDTAASRAAAASKTDPGAAVTAIESAPVQVEHYSDELTRDANEAEKKGDPERAAQLHALAEAQGRTEVALETAAASVNVAFAAYRAGTTVLSALAHGFVGKAANDLATWVRDHTGAVGTEAPKGSVLTLYMSQVLTGRRFHIDSRRDYLVVAILDDGHGHTVRGTSAYRTYVYKGGPPDYVPDDVVKLDAGVVPMPKRPTVQKIKNDPWAPQLAVAASAAIEDLYRHVDGG